jgi:hypothetical protein
MNKLIAALVAGFFAAGAFAAQDTSAPVAVPSASVHAVKSTQTVAKKKVRHVAHKPHAAKKV